LGGGGFADVFLYSQARPARDVAVKVLRSNVLTAEIQASLDAEADLMARVSTHPYIVTIHGTDTAPDGRPYLVMEYYPGASFAEHVRNGGLGVPDVLRLGVRVASAVESAHRAGVLHRDIKPANILTSAYGHPGLTDFGIAGTRRAGVVDELTGVSVPYAPPELLTDASQGDERSDVYSLAATLYALLAGRSPFERPGAGNDVTALMYRAIHEAVPAITRNDVPDMLERALVHGMARQPERRPASMAGFARVLNDVERTLQLTPTAFDVLSNAVAPTERSPDDRDGTRLTRVQIVDPHARPAPSRPAASAIA
jgi:serine/threonine protein kinase